VPRKLRRKRGEYLPTLADVARSADVSQITVSRVVRNKGSISLEMRKRVTAAIKRTGYVPNRLAGSLASAGADLVGVVVPTLRSTIFHHVLHGINDALAAQGYRAIVGTSEFDENEEYRLVHSMTSWRPAAMIIASFQHKRKTVAHLKAARMRFVEITDIDREPSDVAIGLSHWRAGLETGRYMIARATESSVM